ncbi:MAG TPA: hypothetical protein VF604_19440 [Pyrinomonadaceae bacterium]
MRHFEIGLDNQRLSWQEHLFSDVVREMGDLSDLISEPVFDHSGKSIFTIVPETEVSWDWNDWEYAEKIVHYGKTQAAKSQVIKYPEKSSAQLNGQASAAISLEIVFYGEQEQTGAVKQHLSDKYYADNIGFEMRGNAIIVGVKGGLSTENLIAEKYGKHGLQQKKKINAWKFGGRPQVLIPAQPFGEFLVVVKQIGQKRKMLQCKAIGVVGRNETGWIKPTLDEVRELKAIVEGAVRADGLNQALSAKAPDWDEWLDNWSRISQEKFLRLAQMAGRKLNLAEQEARRLTQHHPTGLCRALVLHALDCPYFRRGWWKIEALDRDDFLTSVGSLKKGLVEILASMPTLEGKIWAIKEAENDCLPQAIRNVKDFRLPVLRRELHLLEKRRNAVRDREGRRKAA